MLLDALEALAAHRNALVLVGAQAVYLWAGEADLAVAPYTTDADLAIDPAVLDPAPALVVAMTGAGFAVGGQPGVWVAAGSVQVDLLVPDSLGGAGRRGARLGPHWSQAARKARGLEAALLVAKLHKLRERSHAAPDRLRDKDALDVLRLLRATDTAAPAATITMLRAGPRSADATEAALVFLANLFGAPDAPGARMAARAAAPLEGEATIAASVAALTGDLRSQLDV